MERLSAESIRSNFQEIYRFGCRWLDTEGERNVRETILTKFEDSLMDNVYLEWFQCHNYIPKECRLEIMSPINLDIRCEPLEYSENSEIEGELVFLGELKEDDAATLSNINIDLEGKICLIISDTPAFYIPELVERGAAGVIVATDAPDNLIRMLAARSYPPTLEDPLRWRVKISESQYLDKTSKLGKDNVV